MFAHSETQTSHTGSLFSLEIPLQGNFFGRINFLKKPLKHYWFCIKQNRRKYSRKKCSTPHLWEIWKERKRCHRCSMLMFHVGQCLSPMWSHYSVFIRWIRWILPRQTPKKVVFGGRAFVWNARGCRFDPWMGCRVDCNMGENKEVDLGSLGSWQGPNPSPLVKSPPSAEDGGLPRLHCVCLFKFLHRFRAKMEYFPK